MDVSFFMIIFLQTCAFNAAYCYIMDNHLLLDFCLQIVLWFCSFILYLVHFDSLFFRVCVKI
jgi:hypothetical protein